MNISNIYNESEEWRRLLLLCKFAVEEISTKINILSEELYYIKNNNPIEHIKTRVKQPKSIKKKLEKKGYEPTPENAMKYLSDISGVRIVCSFTSDIYELFKLIKQQDDITVISVKDYIENPKPNGYQSLHMIIEIPIFLSDRVQNVKVEIQIRTIAMDFWASLEHKLYYKYYDKTPKNIVEQLKECAYIINDLDSKMLRIKFEIDHYEEDDQVIEDLD